MMTVIAAFGRVYHANPEVVVAVTCAWLVVCCFATTLSRARWMSATLWVLYVAVFAALVAYIIATLWAAAQA